jgi:cytochrome c oxidase subunit 2
VADTVNPSCGARVGRTLTADFFFVEGAITTMQVFKRFIALAVIFFGVSAGGVAFAASGQPSPWEMTLQGAASPVMESIVTFHNILLIIITAITLFVLGLLLTVIVKFNARANPTPSRTTHNTVLEVLWTVLPVLILTLIAIPSFKLLFNQLDIPPADVTVKATGKQWFWTYSYPDAGDFEFDSIRLQDKELKQGQPRLLAVDNELVVPVNKNIHVLTTGADVIHAFAVPAFGIKIDSVPGRINETWFKAEREGVYYGQCSELCGKDHAFMPIAVRVVSEADYNTWLQQAKQKYASGGSGGAPTNVAAAGETTGQR